jgi:hypothetical protein
VLLCGQSTQKKQFIAYFSHGMCRALKVCMRELKNVGSAMRVPAVLVVSAFAAVVLSACVVVPVDPKTGHPYGYTPQSQPQVVVVQSQPGAQPVQPTQPQWTTVNARLYPMNDQARQAGLLQASVVDNGAGRGSFSVNYLGQALQGEATRVDRNYPGFGQVLAQVQGGSNWAAASGQRGIANAANNRNSMRCEYLFTAAGQGTGACVVSDGARYQIHFGA